MNIFKKIQYNAPVTLTYALLGLLVLGAAYLSKGESNILLFSVYRAEWNDPLTYFRLIGHVFGHANFQHYASNFIMILLIGPILEEKYGSMRLFFLMFVTAIITGLLNVLFFPTTMLMGASGIVFMLIILSSFVNLQRGKIPVTLVLIIAIYIGQEITSGLLQADNVSQVTHVIGGICGAVFGYLINKKKLDEAEKLKVEPEKLKAEPEIKPETKSEE